MEDYIEIAERNLVCAHSILRDLSIPDIFTRYGGTANLVGSVKTGLLMNRLDIDYHVYFDKFDMDKCFSAFAQIAKNDHITRLTCNDHSDSKDRYVDWHVHYIDENNRDWQLDIIVLLEDSPFVGKAEEMAEAISGRLNTRLRDRILRIKYEANNIGMQYMGMEVYKSVIEDNVSTFDEFVRWKKEHAALKDMWEIETA